MVISWFSAGVSSAIATKMAIEKYGDIEIWYTHIEDQHPDTMRFVKDCEKWFGIKVNILQSELKSVKNACLKSGFVNSPKGAACSRLLKVRPRQIWEQDRNETYMYVWGFDYTPKERKRADGRIESIPEHNHYFPLIEKQINKIEAHGILSHAGIKRPAMYDLGYPNNNCVGCLKGGMGYWNKIRKDFPNVFQERCELEKIIGGRIFNEFKLEDLAEDRGRNLKIIVPDCGLFCEAI